jgi:hypothetical protein
MPLLEAAKAFRASVIPAMEAHDQLLASTRRPLPRWPPPCSTATPVDAPDLWPGRPKAARRFLAERRRRRRSPQ